MSSVSGMLISESEIPLLPSAPLLTVSSSRASQVDAAFLVYNEETEAGCDVAGFCSPASLWESALSGAAFVNAEGLAW